MIIVLGDDDMGQQPGAGAAAGNRVIGCRCRDDGVAGATGELLADVPDHLEPAGHVIERLGDVLADPAQRTAAGGTGMRRLMQDALARQVLRQGPLRRLLRFSGGFDRRRQTGEAAASRSAWSVSSASIANSSWSASRASFSEERPNSALRYRASWKRSLAISAWAVTASRAIAAMICFSASRSSPPVDPFQQHR
jgi:hypothetical protein